MARHKPSISHSPANGSQERAPFIEAPQGTPNEQLTEDALVLILLRRT